MKDRDRNKERDAPVQHPPVDKHQYQSPVLTEYGSVDELVDAGVVGFVPSVGIAG